MKRLELLRRSRGFSQQGLAAASRVGRTRISELECGRLIPGPGSRELAKLALILGVDRTHMTSLLDNVDEASLGA
jgi:transcriptional regulator with XRE-family HTH domain